MASPALANPNTGILRLEWDVPVEIALQYPDGKDVKSQYGPQKLFTLTNGQKIYLDLPVADKVESLGLEPHEPFELCKRVTRVGQGKQVRYEVKRIYAPKETAQTRQEAPRVPVAVSAANGNGAARMQQGSNSQQTNSPQDNNSRGRCGYEEAFTDFLSIALRATTAAERAGAQTGSGVRFDSRDVAAIATSMFIQAGKEGWVSWAPSSTTR